MVSASLSTSRPSGDDAQAAYHAVYVEPAPSTLITIRPLGVYPRVSKRRFNIWLDESFIEAVKTAAKLVGVKASTYMRMAVLEKLSGRPKRGDQDVHQVRSDQTD